MNISKSYAFLLLVLLTQSVQAETITFGIVPQQSANKLAQLWTPITQHLSKKTGLNIKFSTANSIPEFERQLMKGEYDIAYMNPYHFTVFMQKPGYTAVAKQKNKQIKGIIVTSKNSSIQTLEDLSGSSLSFPSEAAFAASILTRSELSKKGVEFTPKYVSSHDSVYLTVARGIFPAGGGVVRTFNNIDPAIKENLRILWTTKGYTPHAIAVHPSMTPDTKSKIQDALISINSDPELLKRIKFNELELAKDTDWDDVADLDITLLDHLIK